jgi:hypothetical protein
MSTKANCILLKVRGKHYYAGELGKFIEIEVWEYEQILNNPNVYYFSTALKKHFEWCAAVGKATTLTFSEALGQTHSVKSCSKAETGSSAVAPSSENPPSLRRVASKAQQTLAGIGLTRSNIVLAALVVMAAFLFAHNPRARTNSPAVSLAPGVEISPAIPVEPEIGRAIPVEPVVRKAIPVEIEIRRATAVESGEASQENGKEKR